MENSAFKRGASAAGFWLRFSKSARAANSTCVAWTLKHRLPTFIGRLPVPIACFAVLSLAVVGGMFVGTILVLGAIFLYMLSNLAISGAQDDDITERQSGHQYRDGNDGFGMYSGPQNVTVTSSRVDHNDDDDW
ncbi:hypothetical protein [Candidatus Pantoea bituminis]|uniref:hypothetical protein n=1 Tax=Candidatus Pantoea bituminis TaxID=2831036 RepID=UPI001C060972|nr:hypothetical protein [Pantoea bituminis]